MSEDQHAPQHMTVLMREAANEVDRLRAALRFYACPVGGDTFPQWADGYPGGVLVDANNIDCGEVARAALGEKP